MKVLFSSVGNSDPITGQRDASMLHICRVYRPDKVYLYLSKDMCGFQRKDQRFSKALEKLGEHINHKFHVELIEKEDLVEVHKFDLVYPDFNEVITDIIRNDKKDEGDLEILVNVSSGTPAMKSALQHIATISTQKITPIQVAGPQNASKIPEDLVNYDIDMQWENNLDNLEGFTIRAEESKRDNSTRMFTMFILRNLILKYDYYAAFEVAKTINNFPKTSLDLIEAAKWRLQYNMTKCQQVLPEKEKIGFFPIEDSDKRTIFEYLLVLKIKLKKGEYADFIRAISPILVKLFEETIIVRCNIPIREYYQVNSRNGFLSYQWNEKKLMNSVLDVYFDFSPGRFRKEIYTSTLIQIIENHCNDLNTVKLCSDLRNVEETIRNPAAHTLVSIDDVKIKNITGFTSRQVMDKLIDLAKFNGIKISSDDLKSYDKMNEKIMEFLRLNHKSCGMVDFLHRFYDSYRIT